MGDQGFTEEQSQMLAKAEEDDRRRKIRAKANNHAKPVRKYARGHQSRFVDDVRRRTAERKIIDGDSLADTPKLGNEASSSANWNKMADDAAKTIIEGGADLTKGVNVLSKLL